MYFLILKIISQKWFLKLQWNKKHLKILLGDFKEKFKGDWIHDFESCQSAISAILNMKQIHIRLAI